MAALNLEQKSSLTQYMNDPSVLYPQRIRYFFHTCKEQISGQYRAAIIRNIDQVLTLAIAQKQGWHDSLKLVISQAVEVNALHRTDCEIFLSHLVRCIPAKNDRPPARQYRRVGQPRAY